MLSTSLKSLNEVFHAVQWIPEELKWENFSTPLREHPIDTYFKNSLIVAVSVTLLNLLTCSLAGYSFAKFTYPGRDLMFFIVLATLMVPLASMIIPLFMVVKSLGWVDTYWGLILPAGTSAFGIFLMRQHMKTIPDDLLEAARLDGSSEVRTFLSIVLPMSKTALLVAGDFHLHVELGQLFLALLVTTDAEHRTLPLGIALFESSYGTNYPQLMAVALLAMLPVLIVFLALQRNFIEALTMSGVKG